MNKNFSRRNWLRNTSVAIAGMLAAQQGISRTRRKEDFKQPFNAALAGADPKDDIKITKLEIIPVHSLRTIFIKMHTNAGIIGIVKERWKGRLQR